MDTKRRAASLLLGVVLAACAGPPGPTATPGSSSSPSATTPSPEPPTLGTATPGSSSSPFSRTTPSPESPTPANSTSTSAPTVNPPPSSSGAPAFVTPIPPAATTAWTGITWKELAPEDPLAQVRSVVRWRNGFVAVGTPLAIGETSRTPVWVSGDGGAWRPLDAAVFGPSTIVLGVVEIASGLVALTVQGGANIYGRPTGPLGFWTWKPPLQAWTSSDGTRWTPHPGPKVSLSPWFGVGHRNEPDDVIFRAGPAGLLVASRTEAGSLEVAISTDGVAWENLPASAFPPKTFLTDIAAISSGFVAIGGIAGADPGAFWAAFWSGDGRVWERIPQPVAADGLVDGPEGLLAADQAGAPGWWSSTDGRRWTLLPEYPPLGFGSFPDSQCSPKCLNGVMVGNGERMLAYSGGDTQVGWTSFDGLSWRSLAISGGRPMDWPDWDTTMIVMPVGVLWIRWDGIDVPGPIWFGVPETR